MEDVDDIHQLLRSTDTLLSAARSGCAGKENPHHASRPTRGATHSSPGGAPHGCQAGDQTDKGASSRQYTAQGRFDPRPDRGRPPSLAEQPGKDFAGGKEESTVQAKHIRA